VEGSCEHGNEPSIYLILPSSTMALESTQPLTEMSTMNFPGGKKRPGRSADNLAAIMSRMSENGSLNLSQP
jgi:hypothetical protein